jgi:hypothetical protein
MNWHPAGIEELDECLSINPAAMGHEIVGRDRASEAWRKLLDSRSFLNAVIESEHPIAGHRIVGFGASVFVSPVFAAQEVSRPKPGMNARIIASIASNQSVVLTEDELRYENTCGGLHVVFLCAAWRRDILKLEQATEVEAVMALACLQGHQGYRLRQALREATDALEVEHIRSQRVFGIITAFEDFHTQNPSSFWNRDRALGISNRADAISVPGSVPAILFSYREPTLRFQDANQQLLIAALRGLTDLELVPALGLKLPAIKKRWSSVFRRVEEVCPNLLPGPDLYSDGQTRGPQKRHHLLAYLREHPEELRPILRAQMSRTILAAHSGHRDWRANEPIASVRKYSPL